MVLWPGRTTTARNPRFDRYTVLGELDAGGFATVYRAWDPLLGREVALKALFPHLAANREVRRRFLGEVQALAQLRHPHIVTVHDAGDEDGQPYFTMELIHGPTLAELLGDGRPLSLPETVAILRDLASAVDYLHAAGLVHRDIKPANIMRDPGGRIVLMDFGIARLLDGTHYTRAGAGLGTPDYMAPEQVLDEEVGPEADIYALGVLAYQLLAGRPPFSGSAARVMHAHVYEPPPPLRELRPDLPRRACDAVLAALAKSPAQRPQSARALAEAMDGDEPVIDDGADIETDGDPEPVAASRVWRLRLVAALAVLLLIALSLLTVIAPRMSHHAVASPAKQSATAATATSTPSARPPALTATLPSRDTPTTGPTAAASPVALAVNGKCMDGTYVDGILYRAVQSGDSVQGIGTNCGLPSDALIAFAACVARINGLADPGQLGSQGTTRYFPATWPPPASVCDKSAVPPPPVASVPTPQSSSYAPLPPPAYQPASRPVQPAPVQPRTRPANPPRGPVTNTQPQEQPDVVEGTPAASATSIDGPQGDAATVTTAGTPAPAAATLPPSDEVIRR